MAEIVGIALAIPAIVQTLFTYYTDTKEAKQDIASYVSELFSLKGIIEYIEIVQKTESGTLSKSRYESNEFERLVEVTNKSLEELQSTLKPKFGGPSLVQRMTWSLKKKEVQEKFARLQSLKTGFLMVLTADNLSVISTS